MKVDQNYLIILLHRLIELGPRMKLELVKIEDGIMTGEVLHHSYVSKTKEEIKELKNAAEKRAFLKLSRKKQQEENVKRKLEERTKARAEVEKKRAAVEAEATGAFKRKVPAMKTADSDDEDEEVGGEKQPKKKGKVSKAKTTRNEEIGNDADIEEDPEDEYDISEDEMMPLDDADL